MANKIKEPHKVALHAESFSSFFFRVGFGRHSTGMEMTDIIITHENENDYDDETFFTFQ